MKLHMQREHFTTKDGGKNWKPKEAYETVEELLAAKAFPDSTSNYYVCSVCNKYHIGRDQIERERRRAAGHS